MIIILGHLDVDPTERDGLIEALADKLPAVRAEEPGCLEYTIAADPADPARIVIVEQWESEEALDAHFEHPNFLAANKLLGSVNRTGGSAQKFRISETAPVRDHSGAPSATYWPHSS